MAKMVTIHYCIGCPYADFDSREVRCGKKETKGERVCDFWQATETPIPDWCTLEDAPSGG